MLKSYMNVCFKFISFCIQTVKILFYYSMFVFLEAERILQINLNSILLTLLKPILEI